MTITRLPEAFYEALRSESAYAEWLAANPEAPHQFHRDLTVDAVATPLAVQVLSGYLNSLESVRPDIDVRARLAATPLPSSFSTWEGNGATFALADLPRLLDLADPHRSLTTQLQGMVTTFVTVWSTRCRDRRHLADLWGDSFSQFAHADLPWDQRERAAEKASLGFILGVSLLRTEEQAHAWFASLREQPDRILANLLTLPPRAQVLPPGVAGNAGKRVEAACHQWVMTAIGIEVVPTPTQVPLLATRYPDALAAWRSRERHAVLAERPAMPARRSRPRS